MNTLQKNNKQSNKIILTWLHKVLKMFPFSLSHICTRVSSDFQNITQLGSVIFLISLLIFDFKALKSGGFFSYTHPFNTPQRKKSDGVKSRLRADHLGLDISESYVKHFLNNFFGQVRCMS